MPEPGVYLELRDFAQAYRICGDLFGDVGPLEGDGYRLSAACSCGPRWSAGSLPPTPRRISSARPF